MTRFAFVTWEGGGNLPPAIGIAQELAGRGHEVWFHGYQPQRAHIEAQGFGFSVLARSGSFDMTRFPASERPAALTRSVWGCPEHLQDVPEALALHPADVLVVDFMMQGALAAAADAAIPVAALAHSPIAGGVVSSDSPIGAMRLSAANELRAGAGLPLLSRLTDGWANFLTLVTTIPDLDPAAAGAGRSIRYVGPIAERFPQPAWDSPWGSDDKRPLVLVSFSTAKSWDQGGRIRNTLEALGGQPVRVLVTGALDVGTLPDNAAARRFVPHGLVLPGAALTVTHCGHGTVTASLAHGVPLVGLPNPAADQPFLADMIRRLGAGVALDGEAGPEVVAAAVWEVLDQPSYRDAACVLRDAIRAAPGAAGAAAALELLALEPSGTVRN